MPVRCPPACFLTFALALSAAAPSAQSQPVADGTGNPVPMPIPLSALPAPRALLPARPMPDQALQSRHFRLAGNLAGLAIAEDELATRFDRVFEYVRQRVGLAADAAAAATRTGIEVWILPPGAAGRAMSCPQRGAIRGELITIYADAATSAAQLIGVLAHEVGHLLMFRQLAGGYRSNGLMLPEGYATWAAGRYMTDWYGVDSLQQAAAGQWAQGTYVALDTPVGAYYAPASAAPPAATVSDGECFARRDHVYSRWGAFVEFLIDRAGHDSFLALLRAGPAARPPLIGRVRLPDRQATDRILSIGGFELDPIPYAAVYGSSLAQLESIWLGTLAAATGTELAD